MAGSRKWFVYTTDDAQDFAIQLDESNTEAVNGGTQDYPDTGVTLLYSVPKNVIPRFFEYQNLAGTRKIKCVALTKTIYDAIISGTTPVATITDPIEPTQTLYLTAGKGEQFRFRPRGQDTGLNDGDAT